VTDVLYHATVYKNEVGEIQGVFAAARDITVRKGLQRRIEATNALLNLFVRMPSRKEYLDAALELIQNWSSCRCAGIRVMNEKDYIPYESYRGFSSQFWESENLLSVKYDQCACIRVVTGNPDPQDHPRMTPAGSFWCNNTFEFVGDLSEEEKARFRGVCVQNGFKSVAIIPVRYREKILGAIHLADERDGIVPLRSIEFIESMAPLIGEAINQFNLEEKLRESESRLRLLSSQLLSVQEAERKRIAREIHDSIGQTLAAIKFGLESKLGQMGAGAPPPGVSIENIISLAQNGIEESRRIQMDLRPSVLDDLGILATIGWFTREFQKVYSHISVERQISVEENEIPDSLRTALFRVMQEAMNNVAKHSKADLARLILRKTAGKIELSIEDNGAGFDPENTKQGLGLTSMRERTELSGGTFAVESTVGKGTILRASWVV
jgi:signal transduction histidine kinase